ncbi:MAG: hypothetical protein E7660_04955 [Ruminococcaceae bacterium]|nr:hypothetical protein [Oscillospiraceae bacterium]
MKNDTVNLLKECDAGVKTAVNSIDEVLDNVHSEKLRSIMNDSRKTHQELGDDIHRALNENNAPGKDPNPMARAMSWMKINWKLAEKPTDGTIANLMYDGCAMGIKSLSGYINQYPTADNTAMDYAKKLVDIEDSLMKDLRAFM